MPPLHLLRGVGLGHGVLAIKHLQQVVMCIDVRLSAHSPWSRDCARAPCNQICARARPLLRTGTVQVQTGPLEHEWRSGQKQQKARCDARHKSLSKTCTRQHALNSHCAKLSQLARALLMKASFYLGLLLQDLAEYHSIQPRGSPARHLSLEFLPARRARHACHGLREPDECCTTHHIAPAHELV